MVDLPPLKAGPWQTIFFTTLSCGLFLSLVLIITALASKRVRRLRTWIEFMSSVALLCLSMILLPIFGYGGSDHPPFALCLIQASLAYASELFAASSGACFILEVYYMIYISLRRQHRPDHHSTRLFIVAPPFLAVVVFSLSIWVGIDNPGDVSMEDAAPYCHIVSPPPSQLVTICIIISASCAAIPSVYIIALVYSNWRDYRRMTQPLSNDEPSPFSLSVLIRIALFMLMIAVALVLDISGALPKIPLEDAFFLNIGFMTLPIVAVLMFGTQRDIARAWAYWLRIY
ncbi:hypothetical protein BD779DRAFT_102809 [Infundibulicybe gibba]|nr:hypothetical protein BD779DRAFT_102809 [Infundibulicybe gibba]